MSYVWDNHLEDSCPYFHFIKKTIYDGTVRIMKIVQKIRFNCQLFLWTTILEQVVEAL